MWGIIGAAAGALVTGLVQFLLARSAEAREQKRLRLTEISEAVTNLILASQEAGRMRDWESILGATRALERAAVMLYLRCPELQSPAGEILEVWRDDEICSREERRAAAQEAEGELMKQARAVLKSHGYVVKAK